MSGPPRYRELGGHSTLAAREAELVSAIGNGQLQPREGPPAPQAPELPTPYVALRLLGEGGMGQVWEGRHTGLDKRVAIKVLRTDQRENPLSMAEARARFARESRVAAAVHHENVVEISDVGETTDGQPFQVMELLEGPTLKQLVASEGALPFERAARILAQLADALAFAHRIGVIHRDLKPSNVVVIGRRNEPDYCKLIDFGLAKPLDLSGDTTTLTQSGKIFGSPAYMSPEQCRGEEAGAQSDIYALGCITFFVLCGRRPFSSTNLGQLIYQQQFERVDPREFLPDTPQRERIAQLIERCLDKDPQTRLASAEVFAQELEEIAKGAPPPLAPTIVGAESELPTPSKARLRLALAAALIGAAAVAWGLFGNRSDPATDAPSTQPAPSLTPATSSPDPRDPVEAAGATSPPDPQLTPEGDDAGDDEGLEPEPKPLPAAAPGESARTPTRPKTQAKAEPKPKPEPPSESAAPATTAAPTPAKVEPTPVTPSTDDTYVPDKPSDPFGSG